jgi:hypothetical protein
MSRDIAIYDLKARDKLLIQTQHSTYCFTVIDPVRMSGFCQAAFSSTVSMSLSLRGR